MLDHFHRSIRTLRKCAIFPEGVSALPNTTYRLMHLNSRLGHRCVLILIVATLAPLNIRAAERTTFSLDGTWDIEDSKEPDRIPAVWKHKAPVPGLAHSAQPAFSQVDEFDSRMLIQNRVRAGKQPKSALVFDAGVSHQDRNWFWYHRTFDVAKVRRLAILRINKAQFGAAAWLNGIKIGEHLPCFTAAIFDVSHAIRQVTTS